MAVSKYVLQDRPYEQRVIPIGAPIANTRLYILDASLQPVPVGVPGEIHAGGVGIARGYLNQPDLTAQKFIPDPFSEQPGARLYKTGDLARYLPDGNIEFLGRIDHQVKVRGYRIELGEIESLLAQHPSVQACAVISADGGSAQSPEDGQLVAYVVPEPGAPLESGELRGYLLEKLPHYMIPSAFVPMEALPYNANGKLNRKALPAPDATTPTASSAYLSPRDALELQLVRIWEEALNVRPVEVRDNFFELGGHSLIAVRVMAMVEAQLERGFSLTELFKEPTIEHLAAILRQGQGHAAPTPVLVPIQPKGEKRPVFFVHPSGGSVHWYADLARELGANQPFYGVQAQGLTGDQELHTRVEDMAACYVSAIREFQPQGPYVLGSWSMGVVIAFEMAQQLRRQGQEVGLLAILDQGPFYPKPGPADEAAYLVDLFGQHLDLSVEKLRELASDERIAFILEEARRVNWIYPDVTFEQFRHYVRIMQTQTDAWIGYTPAPYPGRLTLFRATDREEGPAEAPDLGWGKFALGGVEIVDIPGDHLSMVHAPDVQRLARELQARLEELQVKA